MATPITRPPYGLLDLLGTKAQGRNPPDFGDVVAGVVDMRAQLLLPRREYLSFTPTGTGPSLGVDFVDIETVPDGEVWYLWGWGCTSIFTTAAGQARFAPIIMPPLNSGFVGQWSCGASNTNLTLGNSATFASIGDLWLSPGERLGLGVSITTGGTAWDAQCVAAITRLSI